MQREEQHKDRIRGRGTVWKAQGTVCKSRQEGGGQHWEVGLRGLGQQGVEGGSWLSLKASVSAQCLLM